VTTTPVKGRAPLVLVAHESLAICATIYRIVEDAGYRVITACDGKSALALAVEAAPEILVADVALPAVAGHELCDEIRQRALPIKVVLVASVYHRTAYKRRPNSLYGADDYIEQHHIPDALVAKIGRLLPYAASPQVSSSDPQEAVTIRQAAEGRLIATAPSREEAILHARRLAALIVADIALYNGDAFTRGLKCDELLARLHTDLDEGRRLLAQRVSAEIYQDRDFIREAVEDLVAQRSEAVAPCGGDGGARHGT
jgi:CheY-like chemotaxis protein